MDVSMVKNEDLDKRKAVSDGEDDSDNEIMDGEIRDGSDGKRGWQKIHTKQNHSKIEKRRRDKMNTYISELSSMIPMCNAMSRKLDKLTVLRMAVQHMKTLKGSLDPFTETNYKPSFLSDEDLKNLILEAAEGFLFVVGCDRGCLLYASDSIQNYLYQSPSDLIGHSFFDLIHPKDVSKVKEQLSSSDTTPREKLIDAKTGLPLKTENTRAPTRLCSGARRSFFCRMKCGTKARKGKDGFDPDLCLMKRKNKTKQGIAPDKRSFIVVHCTGYLKSWPPSASSFDDDDEEMDSRNLGCLVAVGRVQTIYDETTDYTQPGIAREFISRHSIDGKFIFVDQRTTAITGFLPQELIGNSGYEFFHQEDLNSIAVWHRRTLLGETVTTDIYRFRCKAGHFVPLRTKSTVFRNPWSKELEFLICYNQVVVGLDPMQLSLAGPAPPDIQSAVHNPALVGSGMSSSADSGLSASRLNSNVQQVLDMLKKRQSTDSGTESAAKKMRSGGSVDSTMAVNIGASRIGVMVAKEVQSQEGNDKGNSGAHFGIRDRAEENSLSMENAGDISTINMDDLSPSGIRHGNPAQRSAGTGQGMTSAADSQKQISQAHLLEQLIGMQNAIESMETPMEQSEETMSVFMSMLEADSGLGGEFEDLSFKGDS